ncbi:hypothetical protein BP00DRAFT_114734 [Aspergillus indologenus CBS 114.80]|uniref:DUF3533 domain-containing protein n=1 Tax=Aspergillus indologenus CBS 114.80 TaxID=1450541 RepID=A0A2V5IAD4_9EURO|nr:hypothetical protein BP00DRAFT_114734 [Aspergillus indologenus CBS 114.80]
MSSPPARSSHQDDWKQHWKSFLGAVGMSFLLLQLLFLGNMSYLYGTQYRDSERIHQLKLLYVDFDGDVIGQSVLDAYGALQGATFPTLHQASTEDFASGQDVRNAVCHGDYWGAIYVNPGASARLAASLSGDADSNTTASTALTYIWNGARYPAFAQSAVYSNLLTLIEATRSTYYARNASNVLQTLLRAPSSSTASSTTSTALTAFLDPITATEHNIKATAQGGRVLYNTVSIIMPIIQQFFFMMALNGLSAQFRLFTRLPPRANGLLRLSISGCYTCVGALGMVGYIWAFREAWAVSGGQFVLGWMAVWLYMHIHFQIVDVLTTYVPLQFMPFCILTWAILNVASTVSPFAMQPAFFRWAYALPAHELYQVLVQIWSDGCENQLRTALPVLFSWWVVGAASAVVATHRRCRVAVAAAAAAAAAAVGHEKGLEDRMADGKAESVRAGSSTQGILPGRETERRNTIEMERLESAAYGPRYPTPLGSGDAGR